MGKATALYFEVLSVTGKGQSLLNATDKNFPDGLGPFSVQNTIDVKAEDLRFTADGRNWTAHLGSKEVMRKHLKGHNGEVLGSLVDRRPITFSSHELAEMGIPHTVETYAWTSLCEGGINQTEYSDTELQSLMAMNEPDLCFLLRGGFLYFNKAGECVTISSLVPSGVGWLSFGPPKPWFSDWTLGFRKKERFAPVTIKALSAAGATEYCWITPNEVLGGQSICPFGGFAYLFPNGLQTPSAGESSELESLLATRKNIVEVFRRADTNGNNSIDRDELKRMMQLLDQETWDDNNLEALVSQIDRNRDGQISYVEFVEWLFAPLVEEVTAGGSAASQQGAGLSATETRRTSKAHAEVQIAANNAAEATFDPCAEARSLGKLLPAKLPRLCILGGQAFHDPLSGHLVKAVAALCASRLANTVVVLTGGMKGVQDTFARAMGPAPLSVHLLPVGQESGFGVGRDVSAGSTLGERMAIYAEIGDVYLTFEGGPGVAKEAAAAVQRGATVLPVVWTGGASGGKFNFPLEALDCPCGCAADVWKLICDKGERQENELVRTTAEAVITIIAELVKTAAAKR